MTIFSGDIGGTKALMGIYSNEIKPRKLYQKKYSSLDWLSLEDLLKDFMSTLPVNLERPIHGCLGVAGQVINGKCNLTNLSWEINEEQISKICKLKRFKLVNDVSVLVYGIPHLNNKQYTYIQQGTFKGNQNGIFSIISSGTGLGIARGYTNKNQIIDMPSEGGHKEFSARSEIEWSFVNWLKKNLDIERVSQERIISGTGIGHIAHWRINQPDGLSHPLREQFESVKDGDLHISTLPELVTKAANKGDPLMKEVLEIWISALGSASGDLALHELCDNGLWIAGGASTKQIKRLASKEFIESFQNKGRFRSYLSKIPVAVITDPEIGIFSSACKGGLLAKSNERLI